MLILGLVIGLVLGSLGTGFVFALGLAAREGDDRLFRKRAYDLGFEAGKIAELPRMDNPEVRYREIEGVSFLRVADASDPLLEGETVVGSKFTTSKGWN